MEIESVKNHVIFQFVENISSNRFVNSTSSGILISTKDVNQSSQARWGKVTHIGEKVTDVAINDFILIAPGMWTTGFYVDAARYWKTDEANILAISDTPHSTY